MYKDITFQWNRQRIFALYRSFRYFCKSNISKRYFILSFAPTHGTTKTGKKQMANKHHLLNLFSHCPKCGAGTFREDTEKSKRCEACGFTYFMNPSTSTVAVIVDGRNRLLVVRRSREPAKGTLDLPGGFCDCHETGEEGVRREVFEETGLSVVKSDYLFSLPNMYHFDGLDIPTLDLFFRCDVADTRGAEARDDAAEVMWLPLQDVKAEDFGLKSISLGVSRLLRFGWAHQPLLSEELANDR